MALRMRRPETKRLQLTDGEFLTVKMHLTAGERRAIFARMMTSDADGMHIDTVKIGLSKVLGYLLDWSAKDPDGKPVEIRDKPIEAVEAALDALDPESFAEILAAIEAHEEAMTAERTATKNELDGGSKSPAISPSLVGVAGDTNGSAN